MSIVCLGQLEQEESYKEENFALRGLLMHHISIYCIGLDFNDLGLQIYPLIRLYSTIYLKSSMHKWDVAIFRGHCPVPSNIIKLSTSNTKFECITRGWKSCLQNSIKRVKSMLYQTYLSNSKDFSRAK